MSICSPSKDYYHWIFTANVLSKGAGISAAYGALCNRMCFWMQLEWKYRKNKAFSLFNAPRLSYESYVGSSDINCNRSWPEIMWMVLSEVQRRWNFHDSTYQSVEGKMVLQELWFMHFLKMRIRISCKCVTGLFPINAHISVSGQRPRKESLLAHFYMAVKQ